MTNYIKRHEKYILDAVEQNERIDELLDYHNHQIRWLQHERLVHLFVLIMTGLSLMLSLIGLLLSANLYIILLFIILCVLTFAYIIHYYYLENAVQRWYRISNMLQQKLTGIGTNLY